LDIEVEITEERNGGKETGTEVHPKRDKWTGRDHWCVWEMAYNLAGGNPV